MPIKAFIDSDIIISSLISNRGAAFLILNNIEDVNLFYSNYSYQESKLVCERMSISTKQLEKTLTKNLMPVAIKSKIKEIKKDFSQFTNDEDDCHIVAGAKTADCQFIVTYNTKDYCLEEIKEQLKIVVLTPGDFLQYLRK